MSNQEVNLEVKNKSIRKRGPVMKPISWLIFIALVIVLIAVAAWILEAPSCPDVPGYKSQHPNVSCR